ncbi:MAG TPA: hypothetical protein VMT95_08955 [Candidatus Binatia bacterium]|nr:hypothetical protein [Candidatus Binatia bacterium]
MSLWLTNLPSWVTFVLVLGVSSAIALAATFLARGWYGSRGVTCGPAVVSSWATCIGALVAVMSAFTVITLWGVFARAQSNLDTETGAIRLASRDIAPSQLPLLKAYISATAAAWPRMCGGTPEPRVTALLKKLERVAKPRAPEYANNLFQQLTTMEEMRAERWHGAYATAPPELKITLSIMALTLFGVLAIAMPERRDTHVALTLLVAFAIGAVFWVMIELAYPYCGSVSISPEQILRALDYR